MLQVMGVPSNKDYLSCVLADPRFADGETTTSFLKELDFSPHGIEVVDPGMNTTVQVTQTSCLELPVSRVVTQFVGLSACQATALSLSQKALPF